MEDAEDTKQETEQEQNPSTKRKQDSKAKADILAMEWSNTSNTESEGAGM